MYDVVKITWPFEHSWWVVFTFWPFQRERSIPSLSWTEKLGHHRYGTMMEQNSKLCDGKAVGAQRKDDLRIAQMIQQV